jgi:single-strand DNA-binding protein
MNKAILIGRLVRDPDVRYTQDQKAVARYTLAVDRKYKKDGEQSADFISCVAFGKNGEFVEKYLHQGTKIAVEGRIQTGSYTKQDGTKVYTTDIVVDAHEFVEKKSDTPASTKAPEAQPEVSADGFMSIPDGIDEELPFQ